MDTNSKVNLIKEFIVDNYQADLLNNVAKGWNFVDVDFAKLAQFSPVIADELLDSPIETLKIFDIAATQIDMPTVPKNITARFFNLPLSESKNIWELRKEDIDKLITFKGFIKRIGELMHGVSLITYKCSNCEEICPVLIFDMVVKPEVCPHCLKDRLFSMGKETFDLLKLVVEEDQSNLASHSQKPRRIMVLLKDDLCRKDIDRILQPSLKVIVTGIVKDKPIKKGSAEYIKFVDCNHINVIDESYVSMEFTDEEVKKFHEIALTPTLNEDMCQSIFPTIHSNSEAKLALFLQLVGAVNLYKNGELEERGFIHVLLVSSPGAGKSAMLKKAMKFIPGSKFGGGKGVTGAGLVAAVVKDEELGGYSAEAGIVPCCNKSNCYLDELDKVGENDIAMLNNAMVDGRVNIDKANVHVLFETDTGICGAANPINRIFDNNEPVWKQIGLPKDFTDRFDIIFPIDNMREEKDQRSVATLIFSKYKENHAATKPKYDNELVKKYIGYARKNIRPQINEDVEQMITENFINLTKPSSTTEEQAFFSTRLLTNIIRLSVAVAKARLSNNISIADAKIAIDLLIASLKKQQIIGTDGLLDVAKLEAIVPKSKRESLHSLVRVIKELDINGTGASYGDIKLAVADRITEEELDKQLRHLADIGDIFEPRRNCYKVIQ